MELLESIERINKRLRDQYGIEDTGESTWRVVFSEDEIEKKLSNFTDEGFELLTPIVVERPKYRQWINQKYVLERATPVLNERDRVILDKKYSYEPVWVFEDNHGKPLPPKWEAIVVIINTIHKNAAQAVGVKYKDPESNKDEALEQKEIRLQKLQEDLFGNETEVGDALAHKQAIVVPGPKSIQ